MNRKASTKDEFFMVKLLELATALGDPFAQVDRYAVGKAIGQNDKGVDNIAKLLAQANFIKKGDGNAYCLTPHGHSLALSLTTERK